MKRFSAIWNKELEAALKEVATEPYTMSLMGNDRRVCKEAVNKGIDSHLEACFVPDRGDRYDDNGSTLVCVVSPESLRVLVRRLMEAGDVDLASCICYTLDIDLV